MRVLQVIAEMGSGGAEAVVAELSGALPELGVATDVASAGGRRVADLPAATRHLAVPLPGRSPVGVLTTARALAAVGREASPDVVHAHNVGATVTSHLGLRRGRRRGTPLVATFHGVAADDYPRAARLLDRCADALVVVAPEIGARLQDAGLRRLQPHVVVNAVSAPVGLDRRAARAALGLSDDEPVALCAARFAPQKRHDVLLDAWSRRTGPGVLLLAGAGEPDDGVRARAAALGDRVRLLGERDDVPSLLAAADAFVLSSDWEGLPMALLEALAAGLPVVATDVDGVGAAVGPLAARLVPRRDAAALADALGAVLADPALRRRMGAAARERSQAFSVSAMARAYADVYAEISSTSTAVRPPRRRSPRSLRA